MQKLISNNATVCGCNSKLYSINKLNSLYKKIAKSSFELYKSEAFDLKVNISNSEILFDIFNRDILENTILNSCRNKKTKFHIGVPIINNPCE